MLDRIFLVLFAKLVIPAGAQGLIYELTKAIFGDAEKFKVIDRIFWDVLLSNWVEQEPAIPCHEGALHYFKENHIRQNFKSFAGAR
ncbi:MAG: hypothetical protein CBB68_03075 [Rhodospirillaceae bacterium TMED8]|nr:hypothetical protein [Magnetovibrio sp.]OUT52350.1 MAG: hypothetical protein CBB68_03075 [Rhodospirillaceae bacterium TMED8]